MGHWFLQEYWVADLSKFELDQGTGLLINDSDIVLDGIDVSASLDESS